MGGNQLEKERKTVAKSQEEEKTEIFPKGGKAQFTQKATEKRRVS